MNSVRKRDCVIDSLKGFAILLVVIGHVMDGYLHADMFAEYHDIMFWCFRLIYAFHMPLFFVISGYVFHLAYVEDSKVKGKLKIQILNVVSIYIIYSIVFGAFKIICSTFTNSDVSFNDLLMIPLKAIGPYWYLYVLALFYIMMLIPDALKIPPPLFLGVALILSVIFSFIRSNWTAYLEIRRFFYFLPFFYMGILINQNKFLLFTNKIVALVSLMFSVLLMIWFHDFSYGSYDLISGWSILIAFGCTLAIYNLFSSLCRDENKACVRVLSSLGKYSLEIYVFHCIFTAGNRVVFSKLHIDNFYFNIFGNLILSTGIPIVISLISKKIGAHNVMFKPVYFILERRIKNEI